MLVFFVDLSLSHPPPPSKKKHPPQPQTTKLTITSRLNASLDLELKPAGSGRDRLRVLNPSNALTLPPRGTATVEVELAVDASRFAPGPLRFKAATEGIRDALWVKGLYFDMKVPATWFLEEAATTKPGKGRGVPSSSSPRAAAASLSRSSPAKKLPRLPAMPSPSPVKRRTTTIPAVRDTDAFGGGGGHAPPASLSEDEGEEERDWGAPPSPPAVAPSSSLPEDLFGAIESEGPVEIDQEWLSAGGVVQSEEDDGGEEEEQEEEEEEGGGLEEVGEEKDFALPAMPAFGSSLSSPSLFPTEEAAATWDSSISPLRAVDELLSSQDRRARGPRQVLRSKQSEEGEEEEEEFELFDDSGGGGELEAATTEAAAAAATPLPTRLPSRRQLSPPATVVSRAAALEAVLAQQEGANAELRRRVRELAAALEEARASTAAAERGALLAATDGELPDSPDALRLLARERAERRARDAAVLKLLRAKDDAFAALEVRAADAAAKASEERRGREAAERESDLLAGRVRKLSAELARRDAGEGKEEEAKPTAAELAAGANKGEEEERESEPVHSLRRALAAAGTRTRELERASAEQRLRASEAEGTAELLRSQLRAAVSAAGASSAPEASAAAAAAAAFSKYRQERHADALRFEAAVYSGLASLSPSLGGPLRGGAEEGEDGEPGSGSGAPFLHQSPQRRQRLPLLSTDQPAPPPLPPSTSGNLALTLEAALAVDAATSSSRERAVREATASAAAAARAAADEAARARARKRAKAAKEAAAVEAALERERAAGLERELEQREGALRELGRRAEELRERLARVSEAGEEAERQEEGGGGAEKSDGTAAAKLLLLEAARCSLRCALRSAEAMRSAARACDDTGGAPCSSSPPSPHSAEEAARVAGLSVEEAADLLGVGSSERAAAPAALAPAAPLARVVASALDAAEVAAAAGGRSGGGGRGEEEEPSRRVVAAAEAVAREAQLAETQLADAVARLLPPLSTVTGPAAS